MELVVLLDLNQIGNLLINDVQFFSNQSFSYNYCLFGLVVFVSILWPTVGELDTFPSTSPTKNRESEVWSNGRGIDSYGRLPRTCSFRIHQFSPFLYEVFKVEENFSQVMTLSFNCFNRLFGGRSGDVTFIKEKKKGSLTLQFWVD